MVDFINGVLFSNDVHSETYHIMTRERVIRDVLVTSRERDKAPHVYNTLYKWMCKLGIDALWVHPDNQLSIWVQRSDFNTLGDMKWFSPDNVKPDEHPFALRLFNKYIYFPAYGELVRKHRKSDGWIIPSPDILLDTVEDLQIATGTPFIFSCGNSVMQLQRGLYDSSLIKPFIEGPLWDTIKRRCISRPMWKYRTREKPGLADYMLEGVWYIHVLDKNGQYLGAMYSMNKLPIGRYVQVNPDSFNRGVVGIWEYELRNVSRSMFNGYTCYCPLSRRDNWASTSMIQFAYDARIEIELKRGIMWDKTVNQPMGELAKRLWSARQVLEETYYKGGSIAAKNARETAKKYYLEWIGRLVAPYSREYFHPDWNMLTVHEAIRNQGYSLLKRKAAIEGNIILVSNDTLYLLSRHKDVRIEWGSFLEHEKELKGYKHVGTCILTPEIQAAFREVKEVSKIEAIIKEQMKQGY